ncbi:helix-turn-helix transcriptional regulator [Paraburkholderia sp. A1RO-5L]|uniref:helix-turn-helix transcriptional regulator n=1 Tax=unclassified Paraburkholderia TaxID=2615204 RepID=UPI003B7DA813
MTRSQTETQGLEAQRRAARAANLAAFGLTAMLTTDEAAAVLNRQPQTLRKWASLENGPIRPVRIHGRLGWRVADIEALLNGGGQ